MSCEGCRTGRGLHTHLTGGSLSVKPSYDTAPRLRSAVLPQGRKVKVDVLRWGQSVDMPDGSQEWFPRSAAYAFALPARLMLKHAVHGGLQVGTTTRWVDTPLGLDAIGMIDTGELGDGVLDMLDRHGEVPCSPGWIDFGQGRVYSVFGPTRLVGNRQGRPGDPVSFFELAIVPAGQLPWCTMRRYAG